jgi:hypothetical protein
MAKHVACCGHTLAATGKPRLFLAFFIIFYAEISFLQGTPGEQASQRLANQLRYDVAYTGDLIHCREAGPVFVPVVPVSS